jgi:hypothetical protein
VPFTLFAWAQARISPAVAGAFLNLEPLVGVALGVAAFGDPLGVPQIVGGMAILAGIGLNAVPLGGRRRVAPAAAAPATPTAAPATVVAARAATPRELTGAGVG